MTLLQSIVSCRPAIALCLVLGACDSESPTLRPVDLRDGQTTQLKTTNQDATFKWRGCEDDLWGTFDPDRSEGLLEEIGRHAAAQVLPLARERGVGGCDAACATIDEPWRTGAVGIDSLSFTLGEVAALGWCPDERAAYEVDVRASVAFACECG